MSERRKVCFYAEVAEGLREASDPTVKRVPHEEVAAKWRLQRAELGKRVAYEDSLKRRSPQG